MRSFCRIAAKKGVSSGASASGSEHGRAGRAEGVAAEVQGREAPAALAGLFRADALRERPRVKALGCRRVLHYGHEQPRAVERQVNLAHLLVDKSE